MNAFRKLSTAHARWSEETFGPASERGPLGPLRHLAREVEEAIAKPSDPMEYADLLLLVLDAARRAGLSGEVLVEVAAAKLAANKLRDWPPSVEGEPCEHVRPEGGE